MKVSMVQRICVLASALIAVGASYLQATGALGQTPAEFSNSGDDTLRAASYAFAIWGVIYAGLISYAVYQLVPGWASDTILRHFGWPSAISMLAIGVWLVAAGADWRWATVGLIVLAGVALIIPLASPLNTVERRDRLLVIAPLALLAGWLTIASALNALTVLTAEGFIGDESAAYWATGGLAAVVVIALLVFLRSGAFAYPLPVIWGLIAVFVAGRGDRPEAAWFALAGAILLTTILLWRMITRNRGAATPALS